MTKPRWIDDKHYAYADPNSRRTLGWRVRAVSARDSTRKTFRWVAADRTAPGLFLAGTPETPLGAECCLYMLESLRRALTPRSGGGVVLLTEGERDALAGQKLSGVAAATSHWGGACRMTPEQAAHLKPLATARGRRSGPFVGVVVDRDDPGYADGLHRERLLLEVGLRWDQFAIVRPADGVIAGQANRGALCVGACLDHDPPCPAPGSPRATEKADLADHVAAGYGIRDFARVPRPELEAAAERWAARRAEGAVYGGPPLPPDEAELIAENKRRNGGKYVVTWRRE